MTNNELPKIRTIKAYLVDADYTYFDGRLPIYKTKNQALSKIDKFSKKALVKKVTIVID